MTEEERIIKAFDEELRAMKKTRMKMERTAEEASKFVQYARGEFRHVRGVCDKLQRDIKVLQGRV